MQIRADIARQVRDLRRRRRLSQVEVARLAGLDQSWISRIEQGGTDFRVDTLLVLASGLRARILIVPDEEVLAYDDLGREESESPQLPRGGVGHLLVR